MPASLRRFKVAMLLITALLFSSCGFEHVFTYKDKTEEIVNDIIKSDYNKAVKCFALENKAFKGTPIDSLKKGLTGFRQVIVSNFGSKLQYKLIKSEKKWSTEAGKSTPINTTAAYIQFWNNKDYGILLVLFDDISGKIIHLKTLDVKQPIPSMVPLYLLMLLALCVPAFNIYIIIQIKRSALQRKWLKYLAIIFLNTPTILFNAVSGFAFKLISFQFLLGITFSFMGYMDSFVGIGIPLGGLYWFWKLRQKAKAANNTEELPIAPEDTTPTE